jgi:hypothetical protein
MSQTPDDDQDPIDALSGDLDNCPSTPKASQNTEKVLCLFIWTSFEI